jgi:Tfp pilus assembly protein PilO
MTPRDRLGLIGLVVAGLLVAVWFLAVAPERQKAAALDAQVSTASTALQAANASLASARAAEAQYPAAYASIVSLGKAVPATEEVPSLLYQLAHVADAKDVSFGSITNGSSGSATSAAAAPAGFSQLPFSLTFTGSYDHLYSLFQALDDAAVQTASGGLQISGRLLTIDSVKLSPAGTSANGTSGSEEVSGTIGATAYVLPAGQGLTAGASASSPSGTGTTSAGSASSSSTTPAVVTP